MQTKEKNLTHNNPVVWFVVLERARRDNNFDLAAKARRELKRLGLIIKYRKVNKGGVVCEK